MNLRYAIFISIALHIIVFAAINTQQPDRSLEFKSEPSKLRLQLTKRIPKKPKFTVSKTNEAVTDKKVSDPSPSTDTVSEISQKVTDTASTSGGSSTPIVSQNTKPHYPFIALKRHIQGTVIISILIDEMGQSKQIKIKQSSGFDILDNSALKAVQKWQFKPASTQKSAQWLDIPIEFKIEDQA